MNFTRTRATLRLARRFVRDVRRTWFPNRDQISGDLSFDLMLHGTAPDMSVCDCTANASNRNAHVVDHHPDCKWEKNRCEACCGSGYCPSCDGEGQGIVISKEELEGMPWEYILPNTDPRSPYYEPPAPEHHDAVSDDLGAEDEPEEQQE